MWQSAELHSTETYPKPSKRVKGSTGECRNSRTSSCIFWTLFSHFSQYNLCFYFRFLLLLESLFLFADRLRSDVALLSGSSRNPSPTKPPKMFQPWGRMRKVSRYLPKTKQNYTETWDPKASSSSDDFTNHPRSHCQGHFLVGLHNLKLHSLSGLSCEKPYCHTNMYKNVMIW